MQWTLISDAEYYQLPEFSASCRTDNVGVRVVVEDVMVEMTGKSRKIGGDVRKCMAGIKCKQKCQQSVLPVVIKNKMNLRHFICSWNL